tara:strand:- start:747 stop:1409 length:663 start_codon:yes stop_codon:yes gene_type:complete
MTNFQKDYTKKRKLLTPEKAVIFIPVSIGTLFSLLLISFLIIPTYKSLKVNKKELNNMEFKRDQLPKLKQDLEAALVKLNETKNQQGRILDLVGGSKNIETYLAKYDLLAKEAGADITLIKPIAIVYSDNPGIPNNANNIGAKNSTNKDPLLASNLEKRIVEIKISGSYESLINFLRSIESLRTATIAPEIEMSIAKTSNPVEQNQNTIFMKLSTYGYQN